jgi:hypothetical protein
MAICSASIVPEAESTLTFSPGQGFNAEIAAGKKSQDQQDDYGNGGTFMFHVRLL